MVFRKPKFLVTLLMIALAAHSVQTRSWAVELSCTNAVLSTLIGGNSGYGKEFLPEAYADSKKILVLSDGNPQFSGHFSLGDHIHQTFPEKEVISTYYAYQHNEVRDTFQRLYVDNTQPLPFKDNSFDTIVLRTGLCSCHSASCCAGFLPQSEEAKRFFREVVRVMDKQSPHAKALLHGSYGVTQATEETWKNLLQQIERESKVKATMHYLKSGKFF